MCIRDRVRAVTPLGWMIPGANDLPLVPGEPMGINMPFMRAQNLSLSAYEIVWLTSVVMWADLVEGTAMWYCSFEAGGKPRQGENVCVEYYRLGG